MRGKVLPLILAVSASAAGLYFATRNVHWQELKNILAQANLFPLIPAAMVSFLTFVLRGWRWKVMLSPFHAAPMTTMTRWQIGGIFINNILPFRAGELVRGFWAGHKLNISKSTVFATIVMERLFDLGTIVIVAVAVTSFFGLADFLTARNLAIAGIGLAVAVAAAFFLARKFDANAVLEFLRAHLPARACRLIEKFSSGLKVIQSKREIAKLFLLSLSIWALDITVIFIVSLCLDIHLTWLKSAMVLVGLILGVMIPAAPGAAGTYEAGGVAALSLFGVEKTLAFSFILFLHAYQYVSILALGAPILMSEGFHLKTIAEAKEEAAGEI